MQHSEDINAKPGVYLAFDSVVRSDRPIPFEPARDFDGEPDIDLVEVADLKSRIDFDNLERFHDAETLPEGIPLRGYRGDRVVIFEYQDFLVRLVLDDGRIEYGLDDDRDAFQFGLMVERVVLPLFALLCSPSSLSLHGGAVALDGVGWSFVGGSGAGKSTTARTLLRYNGQLVADDLTLVDVAGPMVLPGCPAVRLWDVEGAVSEAVCDFAISDARLKRWYRVEPSYVSTAPVPLGGVIVLEPLAATADVPAFEAEYLSGQQAFAAVMEQVISFSEPPADFLVRQFHNVKTLLSSVPVVRVRYRRSEDGTPTHVEPLLDLLEGLDCSATAES